MTTTARAKRNPTRTRIARVALIPDVPAATILTRSAGTSRITATLAGKTPRETKRLIIRDMAAAQPCEPEPAEKKASIEGPEHPSTEGIHIIPRTTLDLLGGEARAHISQREGEGGEVLIEGEVMAFDLGCMGRAVEAVMRRVSEAAALSDAVLEMRVEKEAEPTEACEETVRSLARELSGAGFPVRSDVLWGPAPEGDVWLGVGSIEAGGAEALKAFIEESTGWRVI